MRTAAQDLRYAVRSLRSRPLLFVVATAALGLGVGASAAVFGVVDAVLLRPLPFAHAGRLAVAWQSNEQSGTRFVEVSYPDYQDWRAQSRSFEDMAILPATGQSFTIGGEEPMTVRGRLVSWNFFEVLGARPLAGRGLAESDDRPGAARVAVVGYGLWQRRFGGDPGLVGRAIRVDGSTMTVVGVMPQGFDYPQRSELWTPVVPAIPEYVANRGVYWAIVIGRLAPGVPLDVAREELSLIVGRLLKANPNSPGTAAVLTSLADDHFGSARTALLVLLLAVVMVLLVACANVSALLLSRAAEREREMALRMALGASRGRLARQLLIESGILALAGGAVGVGLAVWSLRGLQALVPSHVPRLEDAAIDGRVLGFSLLLVGVAALVSGLAPALTATRSSLTEAMGPGRAAGPGAANRRMRGFLVAAEVAVALVLLSGAGLLVRTFQNLRSVELGYHAPRLLTAEIADPAGEYAQPRAWRPLYRALLDRAALLPGVVSADAVLLRPLWDQVGMDWHFVVEGQSDEEARRNPLANLEAVTPGYFETMRIPLRSGRAFDERDAEGAPGVLIVGESAARRYWPGQDPIGKRIKMPLPGSPLHFAWLQVVGVAADARYRELQSSRLDMYLSYLQSPYGPRHLVLRTQGDPMAAAPALKTLVREMDRDLVVTDVAPMEEIVDAALGGPRFGMRVLSAFALVALALCGLGTYGMVAFAVGRRTREIGVRMALGARAGDVVALVMRQAMRPVAAGVAVGLLGSLALGRALAGLLFGVGRHDPWTLSAASAALLAIALLACLLPARRAARTDPAATLRPD